jgi:hypothetical protein
MVKKIQLPKALKWLSGQQCFNFLSEKWLIYVKELWTLPLEGEGDLPLGATAQVELWPPEQSASILLYSSYFLPILSLSF